MLSFQSQNYKNFFPTSRVYSKKQTRVTANQNIFKSGLRINSYVLRVMFDFQIFEAQAMMVVR